MPRYAKKTTIDELKQYFDNMMNNQHTLYHEDMMYKDYSWMLLRDVCDEIVPQNDRKIKFDTENTFGPWDSDPNDPDECQYYQLNDFAIAMCMAGGDWEHPVHFALYLDEKDKLRMYIPTIGNCFDYYTKTAFGSANEENDKWPKEFYEDDCPGDMDNEQEYNKYYDMVSDAENIDDMLKDIAARICVRGNDVVPFNKKPIKYKK